MKPHGRTPRRSYGRAIIGAATILAALAVSPRSASGQTYWRLPSTLGGAFAGAGAGWIVDIAAWSGRDLGGPTLIGTTVGIGIGGVLGFIGGHNADRRLARGDTLSRATRATLRVATFLAPVAVGSATAFAIINPSDECVPYHGPDPNIICTPPDKIAPDEMVVLTAIGGGALVGLIAQSKFARALWPRARVGVAPSGRGVMISIPVGR
jgi:uncharacterized membrane protein (Fun14 family)